MSEKCRNNNDSNKNDNDNNKINCNNNSGNPFTSRRTDGGIKSNIWGEVRLDKLVFFTL